MLLGVCGGLAEYFDIDATLIRILFVLGALAGGSTILVYIVLAIVMPAPDMVDAHPREAARSTFRELANEVRAALNWARERLPGRTK